MKINNNIEESYCSFKVSKMLKDMGMAIPSVKAFNGNGVEMEEEPYDDDCYEESYYLKLKNFIYRPTHSIAIKWIWANFGIWISVQSRQRRFRPFIFDSAIPSTDFPTQDEAIDTAILFIFQNLDVSEIRYINAVEWQKKEREERKF